MSKLSEDEIIKDLKNFIALAQKEENFIYYSEYKFDNELSERVQGLLDLYNKEKEKNIKAIEMLQEHIKHCEQEAKGSLNNEICHIALKFDKHLLQQLLEERN